MNQQEIERRVARAHELHESGFNCAQAVACACADLLDIEKETARLNKERAACEKEIAAVSGRLSNEGFVAKAPAKVIESERQKLARATERLAKIDESLAALGK